MVVYDVASNRRSQLSPGPAELPAWSPPDGRMVAYGDGDSAPDVFFDHEKLKVYQLALQLVGWVDELCRNSEFNAKIERRLDVLSTSIALNIAEGNGRFGRKDHRTMSHATRNPAA